MQMPKSCHCGVGTHLRQGENQEGKRKEKKEEKERDRSTEGKTSYPMLENGCAHRG